MTLLSTDNWHFNMIVRDVGAPFYQHGLTLITIAWQAQERVRCWADITNIDQVRPIIQDFISRSIYRTDSRFAPSNEGRRYFVTTFLIGWAQT